MFMVKELDGKLFTISLRGGEKEEAMRLYLKTTTLEYCKSSFTDILHSFLRSSAVLHQWKVERQGTCLSLTPPGFEEAYSSNCATMVTHQVDDAGNLYVETTENCGLTIGYWEADVWDFAVAESVRECVRNTGGLHAVGSPYMRNTPLDAVL